MRKSVVTTMSLALLGALPGEGAAQGLSIDSLMGRWCTEGGAYLFTPTALTVIRVDGGTAVSNANHGKGNKTTFSHFANDGMVQLPATFDDGSKSKARSFHRC